MRTEVHDSVRKLPFTLNYMYEDKIGYEKAVLNSETASSKRSGVLAVQGKAIVYLKKQSRDAWCRGFLNPYESVERIGLGTYAPIARKTEAPIPMDTAGKKT